VSVRLEGAGRLTIKLRAMERKLPDEIAVAINHAAQEIHNESQRAVPVDTGNLRASARIDPATIDRLTAFITYGGTAAAYALAVHETHPTKSKFLERPARAYAAAYLEGLTEAVQKAVR
jgi:hypothetical protein